VPVGPRKAQELWLLTRRHGPVDRRSFGGVRFVPLVGQDGYEPADGDRSS
jgi:protein-L-isoaspartate O-methyltransferase